MSSVERIKKVVCVCFNYAVSCLFALLRVVSIKLSFFYSGLELAVNDFCSVIET